MILPTLYTNMLWRRGKNERIYKDCRHRNGFQQNVHPTKLMKTEGDALRRDVLALQCIRHDDDASSK